jgi:hypothetical protein
VPRCLGVFVSSFFLVVLAACVWSSPERQFLIDFFQACRVYDTTVLARLSTVPCNPKTDGIVQEFELVTVERNGDAARKVTIRARVRSWNGGVSDETMTVGLERRDGRWVVTSLTPPRASQTSPAVSSVPPN